MLHSYIYIYIYAYLCLHDICDISGPKGAAGMDLYLRVHRDLGNIHGDGVHLVLQHLHVVLRIRTLRLPSDWAV